MGRALAVALTALVMAILANAPGAEAALTPTITSYPASAPVSASSHPNAIAAGPDGSLWFTDPYAHIVGRMTTAGALTLQAPVSPTSFQYSIAAGPDGAIWFVSQNPSSISRIDGAGGILTKPLANSLANPTSITAGPNDSLWFTEAAGKRIGRMAAAVPLVTPDETRTTADGPNRIAAGPDGNLWFTEYSANMIGRMSPSGATTYLPLPTGVESPEGITTGPDGALWITTLNPASVVRMAIDGTARAFPSPVSPFPGEITTGPDGALWFSAFDRIARVTADGTMETFPIPDPEAGANGIAAGRDGNVWFAEQNSGRIGRITTPPNATTGVPEAVGAVGATVSGIVAGHTQPTSVVVEHMPTGGGAIATSAPVQLPPSAAEQPLSIAVDGLTPTTAYRYRVVATNPTGTTAGGFSELSTTAAPRCGVMRAKRGRAGLVKLRLACTATDAVRAKAKAGKGLYGKAAARVVNGRVKLRIRPTRKARARLRRRGALKVRISVRAFGGGTSSALSKAVRVKSR